MTTQPVSSPASSLPVVVMRVWAVLLRRFELVLLVVLAIIFPLLAPNFATVSNWLNIFRQAAVIGIVTCGVSWLLIGGTFDLSVGSIVSLVAVSVGTMLANGIPIPVAILLALLVGIAAGSFNGLAVAKLGGNPVIVTLGSLTLFQGLTFMITGGQFVRVDRFADFLVIGRGVLLGIGYPVWIYLGLVVVMHIVLARSRFGRIVYMIGSNERAARLSGIDVTRYRFALFAVSGFTAGLAAILLTSRVANASWFAGAGYEFTAITAAVLGGVALFGGSGSVGRAVIGGIILVMLANAQTIMGVPIYAQSFVQGVVLVAVVSLQVARRGRDV